MSKFVEWSPSQLTEPGAFDISSSSLSHSCKHKSCSKKRERQSDTCEKRKKKMGGETPLVARHHKLNEKRVRTEEGG